MGDPVYCYPNSNVLTQMLYLPLSIVFSIFDFLLVISEQLPEVYQDYKRLYSFLATIKQKLFENVF